MAGTAPTSTLAKDNAAKRRPFLTLVELGVTIVIVAVIVGILLPTLNRRRDERAARESRTCAINLKQIGLSLAVYQHDHNGALPQSIEALVTPDGLNAVSFVCPASGDTPAEGSTPAEVQAEFKKGGHNSYVFLGGGMDIAAGDVVVAYEPSMRHGGAHVLFADGHVDWLTPQLMQPILDDVAAGRRPVRIRAASATRQTTASPTP